MTNDICHLKQKRSVVNNGYFFTWQETIIQTKECCPLVTFMEAEFLSRLFTEPLKHFLSSTALLTSEKRASDRCETGQIFEQLSKE